MFEFSTNYSLIFTSLFIIISVLVSFLFYRKSVLIKWKKYLLILVKSLAVFLLLMLFIQPVLLSFLGKNGPELNVILTDNSRSMNISGADRLKEIIGNLPEEDDNLKLFTFSGGISELTSKDSFNINGPITNLTGSLEQLKSLFPGRQVNSVTVISDGNFNSGANPLYTAKTINAPFITIPVQDTIQGKDIIVYNASYNKTSFINTKVNVIVYLKVFGIDESINLYLEREGSVISEKTIAPEKDKNVYEQGFEITENIPGKYKYRIKAGNSEGELTYKNNYFDFYLEFIDNRIKLLLLSGGPSYDNSAVSRIINRISSFEVTIRTLKNSSEFYEGKIEPSVYGNISAIMLLNFPPVKYTGSEMETVYNSVSRFKIPVIFFAGKNTDYKKLELIPELIPFTVSRPSSQESAVKLQTVSNLQSAANDVTFNTDNLPELYKNISGIIPKPGAVTVILDKFSGEPVMLTRNNGKFNTTAFTAYGLWKWLMKGVNEKQAGEIIEGSIKISLNRNKNKNFYITPVKDFFDYTEDVIFSAEVFDENNNPASNAEVKAHITKLNGEKVKDLDFTYSGGKFISNAGMLSPGDYIIEGDAQINQSGYAKDNNRFTVDTLNTEYLQTSGDNSTLRELANNTGGTFTSAENLLKTISETHNSYIEAEKSYFSRLNLRKNYIYLGLIILFFSIEWVMRKRNNIP